MDHERELTKLKRMLKLLVLGLVVAVILTMLLSVTGFAQEAIPGAKDKVYGLKDLELDIIGIKPHISDEAELIPKELHLYTKNVTFTPKEVYEVMRDFGRQIGKPDLIMNYDTIENNKVIARLTVNPVNMMEDFDSRIDPVRADKIVRLFNGYAEKELQAISLMAENFAGKIVVKNQIENLDSAHIYRYDSKTNTYNKVDTPIYLDKNGYVHFSVSEGRDFILTKKELA